MMERTSISVIIPTLNAAELLETQISTLLNQQLQPEQILIIDSESDDQTGDLAKSLGADLITVKRSSFDHGATRNLGAEHAFADIIVFMTQDALPIDRETLSKLIQPLQQREVVVSYARQITDQSASVSEQFLRFANYPPMPMVKSAEDIAHMGIKTFQCSNVCAAYKHPVFDELGQFPAPAVCNEDMIFSARAIFAGYKVSYTADSMVYHTHHFSSTQLFKRYFDISASLDLEPRIKALGKTDQKGYDFLKMQLAYLKKKRCYSQVPRTMIEIAAKYAGFKIGAKHHRIPPILKRHLGSNTTYWHRIR